LALLGNAVSSKKRGNTNWVYRQPPLIFLPKRTNLIRLTVFWLDIFVRVENASEIGNISRTIQELARRRKSFTGNKLRVLPAQKCNTASLKNIA